MSENEPHPFFEIPYESHNWNLQTETAIESYLHIHVDRNQLLKVSTIDIALCSSRNLKNIIIMHNEKTVFHAVLTGEGRSSPSWQYGCPMHFPLTTKFCYSINKHMQVSEMSTHILAVGLFTVKMNCTFNLILINIELKNGNPMTQRKFDYFATTKNSS